MNKLPGSVRFWGTFLFCWLVWPWATLMLLLGADIRQAMAPTALSGTFVCCGIVGFIMGLAVGYVLCTDKAVDPNEYQYRMRVSFWLSIPFTVIVLSALVFTNAAGVSERVHGEYTYGPFVSVLYAALVHLPVLWWFGWSSANLAPRHKVKP